MEQTAAYTATMDNSRLLGANFRTARNRKRALAVALVTAAVVDNYQLEPLIEDSRKAMSYAKLDKPEQRQAKVFYSDLRTIVGAWGELDKETQKLFLEGNKVFSTLAKEIADARKAAEAVEAASEGESSETATITTDVETSNVEAILAVAALIEAGEYTHAEAEAIATLFEAVDAARVAAAEQARKAA